MSDGKDKERRPATEREASKRQANENAEAARATRQSGRPGVDDDSGIVESLVETLGAPVEGALEEMEERERMAERGEDPGPDQVGGISGQRAQDVPHYGGEREAKRPTRPEDAEAEPKDVAEDVTRDRPGARARR